MNNGSDIVNEVTYIESSDVSIQSLKKKEMKKTKGRVGRTSLVRLLMYKDQGCMKLNPTPQIYGPNSVPMG